MKQRLDTIKPYLRISGILFLAAGSFVFAMFQGGFVSWFLFYTFLPFVLYAVMVFFYPLESFEAERKLNKTECRAGDSVQLTLKLKRRNSFPLFYLVVSDGTVRTARRKSFGGEKGILFPWFRKSYSFSFTYENLPRGEHNFQDLRISTGDMFGLFKKEAEISAPGKILVYPAFYDLTYRQLENFYDQGDAGSVKKLQREHTLATGVREYQPGDQISWVNWKATAKKNEMMTKEFDEKKSHDLFLILDEYESNVFEEAVIFAASFSNALLKKGIQVGYLGTGDITALLPVRGGEIQKQKILNRLARTEAAAQAQAGDVLLSSLQAIPLNAALVVVTGNLTNQMVEQLGTARLNRALTVFCMKEPGGLTGDELARAQLAKLRGIKLHYLDSARLEPGSLEVMAQ